MKKLYTILGLTSLLAFQACTPTASAAPKEATKPTDSAGISKYNMGKCTSCHGKDYDLNALRISNKVVAGMSKADIAKRLTALSKQDILPQSVVFQEMKPHELTAADIATLAAKLGK